jgi:adenosylmethionine---8-amino-7-oxononanoate aminotransferase
MESIVAGRPYLRNARACGMVAAVDIRAADGAALDPRRRTGWHVFREAVRRGALLRPLGDTMYFFPPLNATAGEIVQIAGILAASLDAVVGRG